MPLCRNCNQPFPYSIVIDGKVRNLQHRKFCLKCSPFGEHNTCADIQQKHSDQKTCAKCHGIFNKDDFYKRGDGGPISYCRQCARKWFLDWQHSIKKQCVDYKGGCCILCGYSKYFGSLEFHHLDGSQKDFTISSHRSLSFDQLKTELDKCVLLCSNCHREVHGGISELPTS